MNQDLIKKIKESNFGVNKYYVEIIKEFIENYSKNDVRVNVKEDSINLQIKDLSGSKFILFSIKDGNLLIKVDKTVGLKKYQEVIVYDDYGVMLLRTNCQAILKSKINEMFKDRLDILEHEFSKLGRETSIYTGMIFDSIDLKTVKRPENFGLNGLYTHKNVSYDESGEMSGKQIEGNFNVLNGHSISTLEFPKEEDITNLKEENLNDKDIFVYDGASKLRK